MGNIEVGTGFAFLVQRWRHAARLTQEELAARSGLSPRGIQNLESGRVTRPRRDSVRLLADALGLCEETRAEFERAARAPAGHRGVTDSGRLADGLRELAALSTQDGRRVDLRGLDHAADPLDVLDRLLHALRPNTADAARPVAV
ncbi:MAG: helix-turn-helix domain-containing protein [Actinophytocola sp.]|uniref:helix-turn-helix domain-containing protein n=1 Tax=Actinophytocola sp. TaxID=1872138 RepID=UPI00132B0409|nr:helix-turn-helix transcriptional regulator [Actinophytocola sp.]MPZ79295.1 helix-turn-helix domain-containing protein [Actinophytocola sp.]